MSIDWDATGSWMQAWAGFAQAGVVAYVAYKGADAVKDWRRQRITERKLDLAESVLDVMYRVRRALEGIRHPVMLAGSLQRAEDKLQAQDPTWLANLRDPQRRQTVYAQAIYDRVNSFQSEWDDLWAIMPKARAFLGRSVEGYLKELWAQRATVMSAAEAKIGDLSDDPEFRAQLDRQIWSGFGVHRGGRNEVDDAIAAACENIEAALQPMISDEERAKA